MIDRYNPEIHLGTQPIRVLNNMIVFMFQNSHQNFHDEILAEIAEGKLNQELNLVTGEDAILIVPGSYRTPRIHIETKQIEIHETFLSYVWACSYSIYALYIQEIDFPKINQAIGYTKYPINQSIIRRATDLFAYASSLVIDFLPWEKDQLPNPELYNLDEKDLIEQTNTFYTEAVKFILAHEFAHLKFHVPQLSKETTDGKLLEFEKEADNFAIDTIIKGKLPNTQFLAPSRNIVIEIGIILGFIATLCLKGTTTGPKHPNAEDRLTNALTRLELANDHPCWGMACIGLQLWSNKFDLYLACDKTQSSRDQYFEIITLLKSR